jgi:hypothetical protein
MSRSDVKPACRNQKRSAITRRVVLGVAEHDGG